MTSRGVKRKNNKKSPSAPSRRENFWQKLPRPFFTLAPMANVTDAAFRKMIAKYGKPDVMWTEFVSADGLMSVGRDNLLTDLNFSTKERPIVAQLFSGHPEAMRGASKLVAKLGFDGIDLNRKFFFVGFHCSHKWIAFFIGFDQIYSYFKWRKFLILFQTKCIDCFLITAMRREFKKCWITQKAFN